MKLIHRVVLVSLSLGLATSALVAPPAAGAHGAGARHSHVAPAHHADGKTGSQLLAQGWKDDYEQPTTTPEPRCHYVGRTGKILIAGRIDHICPVPLGYPVFYLFGGTCDTASPPPYFAVTAHDQRRCAKKADVAFIKSMSLAVDDGPAVRITRPRFETYTAQVHVQLPADNIDGAPAGPATFSAHGWTAFATNLSLGLHTTHFTISFVDGSESETADRTIRVVR